jgi:dienelactone hydrolase
LIGSIRIAVRLKIQWLLLLTSGLLAACGAGGGSDSGAVAASPPGRGTLVQTPPELLKLVTAGSLLLELSAVANQQLLTLGGAPLCDIAVHKLLYRTVGGANESTTASAALMIPTGLAAECRGTRPVVLYAHGTSSDRAFNIANLDNQQNVEGLVLAAIFAAQGYIVVAPNYAGYDSSTLTYHPFLNADQQSKDMIDALAAARSALPTLAAPLTRDSGKLFITGYSQGGFVAMATQRAMQAAGLSVTASAPLSGPYALAAFTDAVFGGEVNGSAPLLFTLMLTSYQKSYGNLYVSVNDVYEANYATNIESLLPSTLARSVLYDQGKLPADALFSNLAPDPQFAGMTPATTPANLATLFARGFGSSNLLKNSYRLNYLLDAQANPDGGWPMLSNGLPAASPANALRRAARQNDLRNWTPTSPTLLCGGNEDPTVFWLNTQLLQSYWSSRVASPSPVALLDVDSATANPDPYASLKSQFTLAKLLVAATAVAQGAHDGGARAVSDAYHSTLVPPFCLSAARSFFAAR